MARAVPTTTGVLWVSGFSLIAMALIYKPLLLDTLDPLFLQTVSRLGPLAHGLFLTLVVLNLVIGFQAIGALMVVGLMMLPAIASRFWSRRLPVLIAGGAEELCPTEAMVFDALYTTSVRNSP